jgi:hypothetical protein
MLFGRKALIVHTRPELDQAIANVGAHQIVVDGDSELLSYAEQVVERLSSDTEPGLASGPGIILASAHNFRTFLGGIGVVASLILLAAFLLFKAWVAPTGGVPVPEAQPPSLNFDGLAKLGWIAVALVAIVAVYRVVTKAIEGERYVELAWKITEKFSARLVIKRVEIGRATVRTNRKKTA